MRIALVCLALAPTALLATPGEGHAAFKVLHLSADYGVTTDSSGNVTNWVDQSGQNHHATQGGGLGPQLVSNALNGNAALRFNGTNDFLNIAGQVITTQEFTIIAVVNDTRASNDTSHREIVSNWTNMNQTTSVFLGTTNVDKVRLTDNYAGVGPLTNPSSHFILTGMNSATNATVYQNDTLIASKSSSLTTRNLTAPYVIGRQGTFGGGEFWQGDIAELIIYEGALTQSELAEVWSDLGRKYDPTVVPVPPALILIASGLVPLLFGGVRRRVIGA